MPPIGIGRNCVIDRAIIDKNARIGDGVVITPEGKPENLDAENYFIRDGIVVVPKDAVIPGGILDLGRRVESSRRCRRFCRRNVAVTGATPAASSRDLPSWPVYSREWRSPACASGSATSAVRGLLSSAGRKERGRANEEAIVRQQRLRRLRIVCSSINNGISRLHLHSTRQAVGDDIADGGSWFN